MASMEAMEEKQDEKEYLKCVIIESISFFQEMPKGKLFLTYFYFYLYIIKYTKQKY